MEKLTYLDVIDIAMNLSNEAKNFYESLLKEIKEEDKRQLLSWLLQNERKYLEEFNYIKSKVCDLKAVDDVICDDPRVVNFIKFLVEDRALKKTNIADLKSKIKDFQSILHLAIQNKKDRMAYYRELKDQIKDKDALVALEQVIEKERESLIELYRKLNELFR